MKASTLVSAWVKPGSRDPGWALCDGVVTLRVRERAIEGAANAACIRALATALGISASRVRLLRGERARRKTFEIEGLDAAAVAARLRAAQNLL